MSCGYIKLYRKSLNSGIMQNHKLWTFWTWCLLKATHKHRKQVVGFQEVELLPGQFVFGRKVASEQLEMSEQSIRTCLQHLKNSKNLTIKSTNKYSIITIVNWDTYQVMDEHQQPAKQQTTNQPLTTDKNDKNVKNNKRLSLQFSKNVPIPNYFELTDQMKSYAKTKKHTGNLQDLTEGFILYHRKKGTKFKDWYAAWQTWLRNDLKFNSPDPQRPTLKEITPEDMKNGTY